jgi:hypothetical protein
MAVAAYPTQFLCPFYMCPAALFPPNEDQGGHHQQDTVIHCDDIFYDNNAINRDKL